MIILYFPRRLDDKRGGGGGGGLISELINLVKLRIALAVRSVHLSCFIP